MRFNSSYLRWIVTATAGGGLAFGAFTSVFNTSPTVFGQVIDESVPVIVGQVPPSKGATIHVTDTTGHGTITIPANALSQSVKVHTTLSTNLPSTVGTIGHVLQVINVLAENPKNQTVSYFHQPVTITLTITTGISKRVTAVFWNPLLQQWQPFADVTVHGDTLSIQTRHFTTVAVVPANEVNLAQRVSGPTAIETAIRVAETTYPDGAKAAVLTNSGMGRVNSDALAATGLAGALGAPILYTPPTQLPGQVLTTLHDLHTQTVYVVGGPQAISPSAVKVLQQAGMTVVRDFNGATRFSTAQLVNQYLYANQLTTAKTVFVVNGDTVVGGLGASAQIYRLGAPTILVGTGQKSISAQTLAALQQDGVTKVVVLGGHESVSSSIQKLVASVFGASNVVRIGGTTRNRTTVAADRQYFAQPQGAILGNGGSGPGVMATLAASGLSVMDNVPIVLTNSQQIPTSSAQYLHGVSLHAAWLVGGMSQIGPRVQQTVASQVVAP